jgi:hypothetical protein
MCLDTRTGAGLRARWGAGHAHKSVASARGESCAGSRTQSRGGGAAVSALRQVKQRGASQPRTTSTTVVTCIVMMGSGLC